MIWWLGHLEKLHVHTFLSEMFYFCSNSVNSLEMCSCFAKNNSEQEVETLQTVTF